MKTKKRIHNRTQLRQRLETLREGIPQQEEKIRSNYNEFKSSLSPQNLLIHSLSSITGVNINKKEFLREGVMTGLGLILQRAIFKTESAVEKKVYHVIDLLFKKIDELIHRFASRSEAGVNRVEAEEE